jgi:hypothetical protein
VGVQGRPGTLAVRDDRAELVAALVVSLEPGAGLAGRVLLLPGIAGERPVLAACSGEPGRRVCAGRVCGSRFGDGLAVTKRLVQVTPLQFPKLAVVPDLAG